MTPATTGRSSAKITPSAPLTAGPAIAIQNSRLGVRRFSVDLRHAAEEKEGDVVDRDPIAYRHDRVPQLVQQHAHEQHQRGDGAEDPALRP